MPDNNLSVEAKLSYWSNLVTEQTASGKIMSEFCKERQVCRHTFRYWRNKLSPKVQGADRKKASSRFIAVARSNLSSKDNSTSKSVSPRIILPNGVTIDLGIGLDSTFAYQFFLNLCGVGSSGGSHAKS